jgi:hypothetical protein
MGWKESFQKIPRWNIDILKLLLAIVYVYAGLETELRLLEAMPLKIWLPNNSNLPLIGSLLNETWYIMFLVGLPSMILELYCYYFIENPTIWFYFSCCLSCSN